MRGRTHTREFKLGVVRRIVSEELSQARACREYQLAHSVLERWLREYRERGENAFTPRVRDVDASLEARIAELERHCGQLSVENAALKRALAVSASRSATR